MSKFTKKQEEKLEAALAIHAPLAAVLQPNLDLFSSILFQAILDSELQLELAQDKLEEEEYEELEKKVTAAVHAAQVLLKPLVEKQSA